MAVPAVQRPGHGQVIARDVAVETSVVVADGDLIWKLKSGEIG